MLIGFAVGTMEYLVRFSMLVVSCLCTCTSRIKAEIADAIDDADRAQVAGIDFYFTYVSYLRTLSDTIRNTLGTH
jgi:hypothetical protein